MPNFSAIALDSLLEPGSRNNIPKMGRELSYSEKNNILRRPSPILYATPNVTPLPDSSLSYTTSPYVVNHKRRGPRLLKSFSQNDVVNGSGLEVESVAAEAEPKRMGLEVVENGSDHGVNNLENGNGVEKENEKSVNVQTEKEVDVEDFCHLLDSMSTLSNTEVDDIDGGDRLWKPSTPGVEYYDAFEEISSDGASRSTSQNIEDELREIRLNLLMEIERRKQAEEAFENYKNLWQNLHHQLSLVGLTLPDLPSITDNAVDPAEDLYQQITIARIVAGSVGRAFARAEVEMEMEPQIQSKNFEIARLADRLQYYEAANKEMSCRNQEAIEMGRQIRHKRKRRQRWIWGSIGMAVTLGSAAIALSYISSSNPSSHEAEAPTNNNN